MTICLFLILCITFEHIKLIFRHGKQLIFGVSYHMSKYLVSIK